MVDRDHALTSQEENLILDAIFENPRLYIAIWMKVQQLGLTMAYSLSQSDAQRAALSVLIEEVDCGWTKRVLITEMECVGWDIVYGGMHL